MKQAAYTPDRVQKLLKIKFYFLFSIAPVLIHWRSEPFMYLPNESAQWYWYINLLSVTSVKHLICNFHML